MKGIIRSSGGGLTAKVCGYSVFRYKWNICDSVYDFLAV